MIKKMIGILFLIIIILAAFWIYSVLKIRFTPSVTIPGPESATDGNIQQLHAHIEQLSVVIGSRNLYEYDKIEAAKKYIVTCLRNFGYNPTLQKYIYKEKEFSNIIVTINGIRNPDETVIVGAHYDTALGTPGADDNASAVAVLLEMCRLLKGFSPGRTLKLVFFVNEEPPSFMTENMGSYVYAREAKARNENITAMVCLEMVGYFGDTKGGQTFPLPLMNLIYSSIPNFIAVVGNISSRSLIAQVKQSFGEGSRIPVETLTAVSFVPGVNFSDHRSFWKMGYPAVMITDTAFYRNPNYHTETDTIDTLDFNKMSDLLKGVIQAAKDLTN
jgi:Zn-dependent M28 family amino/carboxypeptidase